MYVHVGEDVMIRSSAIITILEKETVDSSQDIQMYLEQRKNSIIDLSSDSLFKSLIITDPHIYLSPIAPGTIKKRILKSKDYEFTL